MKLNCPKWLIQITSQKLCKIGKYIQGSLDVYNSGKEEKCDSKQLTNYKISTLTSNILLLTSILEVGEPRIMLEICNKQDIA